MSKKSDKMISFKDYIHSIQDNTNVVVDKADFWEKLTKKQLTSLVYCNVYNKLANIILKMYKWKADNSINPRIIELGLMERGWMAAFSGPMGKFILPCTPTNYKNVYGDPTQVRVYGWNGWQDVVNVKYDFESPTPIGNYTLEKTTNEGVFMRDNDMGHPYIYYVKQYAYLLTDKMLASNIAFQRLKSPFTYVVSEKELVDTVAEIANKIESNDDVIIRKKSLNMQGGDSVTLEKNNMNPSVLSEMRAEIQATFNEFLETIGINTNPSPDKSQVVLTSEVNSNNCLIDIAQDIRFLNREKFCEDAKKVGINISVEKNTDELKEAINSAQSMIDGKEDKQDDTSRKQDN